MRWLQRATTLFVFALALAGCWRLWTREIRWVDFTAVLLGTMALGHAFFVSRYRYRLPLEPVLIFVGVLGLWSACVSQAADVPETPVQGLRGRGQPPET